MIKLRIPETDKLNAAKYFGATPIMIARASRKSVNKVSVDLKKRLSSEIPKATGFRVMDFRRIRTFRSAARVKKNRRGARVWLGSRPIPAIYLKGKLSIVGDGVRKGKMFFPKSVVRTMKNGFTGIFHTNAKGKFDQVRVRVDDITRVLTNKAADDALSELRLVFKENIDQEFKKLRKK